MSSITQTKTRDTLLEGPADWYHFSPLEIRDDPSLYDKYARLGLDGTDTDERVKILSPISMEYQNPDKPMRYIIIPARGHRTDYHNLLALILHSGRSCKFYPVKMGTAPLGLS